MTLGRLGIVYTRGSAPSGAARRTPAASPRKWLHADKTATNLGRSAGVARAISRSGKKSGLEYCVTLYVYCLSLYCTVHHHCHERHHVRPIHPVPSALYPQLDQKVVECGNPLAMGSSEFKVND
jgi:hypothetical protein